MVSDDIRLDETATRGRYSLKLAEGAEAELTYSRVGEHLVVIDHTLTPRAFRGQGIALRLLTRAVADFRAAGRKVVPLCPFAADEFRNHPDWADLLQKRP